MIKPTVGRVVWFTPTKNSRNRDNQPWPAFITYVHGDRMINVAGFNSGGTAFSQNSVDLLQDDDKPRNPDGVYASWMPFQVQQAATQSAGGTPIGHGALTPQGMGLYQPPELRAINPDKWIYCNAQLWTGEQYSLETTWRIMLNCGCDLDGVLTGNTVPFQGYETADTNAERDRLARFNHTSRVFDLFPHVPGQPRRLNPDTNLAKMLGLLGKRAPNVLAVQVKSEAELSNWIEYNREFLAMS